MSSLYETVPNSGIGHKNRDRVVHRPVVWYCCREVLHGVDRSGETPTQVHTHNPVPIVVTASELHPDYAITEQTERAGHDTTCVEIELGIRSGEGGDN